MRLVLLAAVLTGCVHLPEPRQLPSFSVAMSVARPDPPRKPILFAPGEDVPGGELMPYARIDRAFDSLGPYSTRALWEQSVALMPDAVYVVAGGSVYAGSIAQYWGFGVNTSQLMYAQVATVWLLRESPAVAPYRVDNSGMIIAIDDSARNCGLLEGDKLMSLNGFSTEEKADGDFVSWDWINDKLQHWRPGELLKVGVIRPGSGHVEASVRLLPNPKTYLQHRSATDPSTPNAAVG